MIPSCPLCGRRDEVERLAGPAVGGVKSFYCGRCDCVLSGSENEARASTGQRKLMDDTRKILARLRAEPPAPTQQELITMPNAATHGDQQEGRS